jgi:hypothetical protein
MTEQINLQGDNILDDYEDTGETLSDDEETSEGKGKSGGTKTINLIMPETKGPEFYETLNKIKQWKAKFPKECADIDLNNESKITYEEALGKLDQCKSLVSARPEAQMHKLGFKFGLGVIETQVGPKMNLKLRGLTNTCCEDVELMKTLDEIALLHDLSCNVLSPEQRLLIGIAQIAYKVNAANQNAELALKMPGNKENYDDL